MFILWISFILTEIFLKLSIKLLELQVINEFKYEEKWISLKRTITSSEIKFHWNSFPKFIKFCI